MVSTSPSERSKNLSDKNTGGKDSNGNINTDK